MFLGSHDRHFEMLASGQQLRLILQRAGQDRPECYWFSSAAAYTVIVTLTVTLQLPELCLTYPNYLICRFYMALKVFQTERSCTIPLLTALHSTESAALTLSIFSLLPS